jgi:L-serine dehydratase
MRAAQQFVAALKTDGLLPRVASVRADLYGSLGATGKGHGSDKAVMLGLEGELPETIDTDSVEARLDTIRSNQQLNLLAEQPVAFDETKQLIMHRRRTLPFHSNGMTFHAYDSQQNEIRSATFYSVGGGFIVDENAAGADRIVVDDTPLPYPFTTAVDLLIHCANHNLRISDVMLENEKAWRNEADIREGLLGIWKVMQTCVKNGCRNEGILPGGMKVKRRAAELYRRLSSEPHMTYKDPLTTLDWVNLWALAVNEENAAGGRVVTAPTNGAAGIIPAVMHYYQHFYPPGRGRRRHRAFPADRGRDRNSLQGERVDLGRRGRLPGRSRQRLFDGGRRAHGGHRRHARAGRKCGRNWHGAQSRIDLRPRWRPGAGALHRT